MHENGRVISNMPEFAPCKNKVDVPDDLEAPDETQREDAEAVGGAEGAETPRAANASEAALGKGGRSSKRKKAISCFRPVTGLVFLPLSVACSGILPIRVIYTPNSLGRLFNNNTLVLYRKNITRNYYILSLIKKASFIE